MSWSLQVWWGYSDKCSQPPVDETFNTKADGITRATEVLSDGYTTSTAGSHHYYPAAGITHIGLIEDAEE